MEINAQIGMGLECQWDRETTLFSFLSLSKQNDLKVCFVPFILM